MKIIVDCLGLSIRGKQNAKADDFKYRLIDKLSTCSVTILEAILARHPQRITERDVVQINQLSQDDDTKEVYMKLAKDVIRERYAPDFSRTKAPTSQHAGSSCYTMCSPTSSRRSRCRN